MQDPIRLSKTRTLPATAVTQTIGIIARRGAGKTYAAGKLVEQMVELGAPVVVLDPVGTWYGLRLAADGKKPGLPIPVLGGLHGDVELAEDAGSVVADLVMDRMQSAILDVSSFRKSQRKRFVADFAERLFERAKKERSPLHVVIEEAQLFAPQNHHGEERMLGAIEDVVRLGRNYGLGATLITQRPQSVNKEILNQVECLLVGQLSGAHERKAIDSWIVANADGRKQLNTQDLPSLPVGTMLLWSPQWLQTFERIKVGRKHTYDASATPELGKRVRARALAPVDADDLKKALASVLERRTDQDPKRLRARIHKLEGELDQLRKQPQAAPFDSPAALVALQRAHDAAAGMQDASERLGAAHQELSHLLQACADAGASVRARRGPGALDHAYEAWRAHAAAPSRSSPSDGACSLPKAERKVLTALAQHGQLSLKVAAMIAGYSARSSAMRNAAGALRRQGYVEGGNASLRATAQGLEMLGPVDPLPVGPELLAHWCGQLGKAEREILRAVVAAYPAQVRLADAAATAGYSPSSSAVRNAAGTLRTLQLVHGRNAGMRASDMLVPAAMVTT